MRIAYTHPHYAHQTRTGTVKHDGPDGCVVVNDETGLEERVRHRDIKKHLDKPTDERVLKSLSHGIMAYATPETLRNIASDYQDQYAPGHPAHLDASECDWGYDPAFPLANLPGNPAEWLAYHHNNNRNIGFTTNPTPIVAVQGIDGHHYVWDGNHRTGEAYAAGWTHVPAIVGVSKIRDDQPDALSPPGSVERSGLRMAMRGSRPLLLLERGRRSEFPIRMQMLALMVKASGSSSLIKAMPQAGIPTSAAKIPLSPQPGQDPVVGEWPQLARPHYGLNSPVQYQRPDMPAPGVGFIASKGGKDGYYVRQPDGGRHEVRHDHIHGPATIGVGPEERGDAAGILARMGVPVDPLEHALLPDRAERPNPHLLARVEALVADGAPIDPAAIGTLDAKSLRRVIEHFAGPLPDEEETRPQRPTMRPQARVTPWAGE